MEFLELKDQGYEIRKRKRVSHRSNSNISELEICDLSSLNYCNIKLAYKIRTIKYVSIYLPKEMTIKKQFHGT